MATVLRDVRLAFRHLLHSPATTVVALATLALGIGANTAMYSVFNRVLLNPLPFPDDGRLFELFESLPKRSLPRMRVSAPNFQDFGEQIPAFASLAAMRPLGFALTGNGLPPQAVAGARVSGTFFGTLGVKPLAGRLLAPEDDRPKGEKVVVLAEALWRQRFGGSSRILGGRVAIDGRAYTVVGVAPASMDFPRQSQIWVPLALDYANEGRGHQYLRVIGRLRPGASFEQAQTEVNSLAARLLRDHPELNAAWGWNVLILSLRDLAVENVWPALRLLEWAVWLVLLIACANVANLLLSAFTSRARELAIQVALGARRRRIMAQLIVESVVLFVAGGVLGLPVAFWGTRALSALSQDALPGVQPVTIHVRVLVYAFLISFVVGALAGLLPAAVSTSRRHLVIAPKGSSAGLAPGLPGRLTRNVLVAAEVALALVLSIGAGLLIQSLAHLQSHRGLGLEPDGVLTARLSLLPAKYPQDAQQVTFFHRLLERVRALPGVAQASTIYPLPFSGSYYMVYLAAEGQPAPKTAQGPRANDRSVSPGYFQTAQIPLVAGRLFTDSDDSQAPKVVIVDQSLARQIWPQQNPLGRRIRIGDETGPYPFDWLTVVGVVGDVRPAHVTGDLTLEIYRPVAQDPVNFAALLVRAHGDPRRLMQPIRQVLHDLDPELPLEKAMPLDRVIASALAQSRVNTLLLAAFAALALALSAVGIYGVVSHTVTLRAHEVGVRSALGATRSEIVTLFLRQSMRTVVVGLVAGLLGSWAICRLLANELYHVRALDARTFAAVTLLLAAVALLAAALSALRSARLDPAVALRSD